MLLLTHCKGDSVYIGDDIKITIIWCENGKVKLGYEAPKSIPILREKVKKRMENEERKIP